MRADLGAWTPSQADVLVRVLQRHGVDAHTVPDGEQTRVSVAAAQVGHATRIMSDAMDEIAQAVDRPRPPARPVLEDDEEDGPPLVMERMRSLGPTLGLLVVALMVALFVPGWSRWVAILLLGGAVAVAVLRGRGRGDDG